MPWNSPSLNQFKISSSRTPLPHDSFEYTTFLLENLVSSSRWKQRHLSPTTSSTSPLRAIISMWERTVSRHVAILVTIKAASSIRSSIRSWLGKTLVCKNRRSHERRWHILCPHCCMTGCAFSYLSEFFSPVCCFLHSTHELLLEKFSSSLWPQCGTYFLGLQSGCLLGMPTVSIPQ